MKKFLYILLALLLLPVVLFVGIGVALYLPPVQQWAVSKASEIASRETGWQVSVGEVRLQFPLDLELNNVVAVAPVNDTVAVVGRLVADVALRPLLDQRAEVKALELNDARINTFSLLSDLHIEGNVGRLYVQQNGIDVDLNNELATITSASLSDAHLLINMSDTAAVDTTESSAAWRIRAGDLAIRNSSIDLHLPGDTMRIAAALETLTAHDADIDLGTSVYQLAAARLENAKVSADMTGLPHLEFDSLGAAIDKLHMTAEHFSAETMDLTTRWSKVHLVADVDMNFADSINPGRLKGKGNVWLSRTDMMRWAEMLAQPTWQLDGKGAPIIDRAMLADIRKYVESDIDVRLVADGNMQRMDGEVNAYLRTMGTELDLFADLVDRDLSLEAEARQQGGGMANAEAKLVLPAGFMQGDIDMAKLKYSAKLATSRLHLGRYVRGMGLGRATMSATVKGQGIDPMSRNTSLEARGQLASLAYDTLLVSDIDLSMRLRNGSIKGQMDSRWPLLLGCIDIDGIASKKKIEATIAADLKQTDLKGLGVTIDPLLVGACAHMDISTDLRQTHSLSVQASDVVLRDSANTYQPDDLWLEAFTSRDTTWARAESGDMQLNLQASGGYEQLIDKSMKVFDMAMQQLHNRVIDQVALRKEMPNMRLYLRSGNQNTVANILKAQDIGFKNLYINTWCSERSGLNGSMQLHELSTAGYQIDTIHAALVHRMSRLIYGARIVNSKKNPQLVFAARLGGHILEHGGDIDLKLYDASDRLGLHLGAIAQMEDSALRMQLRPEQPLLAYKTFTINPDNYILLDGSNRVQANVTLRAADGTGIQLTSPEQDSTALQDVTLSLMRVNLKEVTDIIPYAPHVSGIMEGDYHIVMDREGNISVASDMGVRDMAYEESKIGNLGSQLVYMNREDTTHVVQASFTLDDEEFGLLDGSYHGDLLDATLTLTRLPLSLVNGFVPDQMMGLDGYGQGTLSVKGPSDRLSFNGQLMLDSAYLISIPYGLRMRFDDAPVQIVNSRLVMKDFGLYANGVDRRGRNTGDVGDPLRINGYVDFLDLERIYTNMSLRADNFQLMNARENPQSVAYGKAFVSAQAQITGLLDNLNMRGRLQVLGKTDISYVLRDTPLTTDMQLADLVHFTDFSDTTSVMSVQPPPVEGLTMNMQVDISQAAHVMAYLNEGHSNYVDLTGGGSLAMTYSSADGLSLNGRYTLRGGQMKYSLPVIPLKTFTIKDGSYIEFRGAPMNPTLNITATEIMKSTVTGSDGAGRSVEFECGVEISKTLSDMGLAFTLDAPEDLQLSQELQAMSVEQRGKLAVSMLTTGMYLAEGQGNTEAFTMNDALTSFLNSEINSIAGSALRSVDVQLGVDNTTDAAGEQHTDYSFKFAKRFWNNRIKVQVGGLYSSGGEQSAAAQAANIFDNVSVEYRLDDSATKYVNLFYENNSYDWLEGYTQRYGAGFIWRRSLARLRDIFHPSEYDRAPASSAMSPAVKVETTVSADSLSNMQKNAEQQ